MKVLSIQQPWASLIVQGHKKIETRTWATKYRGPLLIHAAQKGSPAHFELCQQPFFREALKGARITKMKNWGSLPFGAIIGQVNLVGTKPTDEMWALKFNGPLPGWEDEEGNVRNYELTRQERAFGDYSPGRYGWLLSDPVVFDSPIDAKGRLGLWEYDLSGKEVWGITAVKTQRRVVTELWLPTPDLDKPGVELRFRS